MNIFLERMVRAAKLDANLYEEVEADTEAITQSLMVVLLISVIYGILSLASGGGFMGLVFGSLLSVILWFIWVYVVFAVGTRVFPESQTRSDIGEVMRTTGFAGSPRILAIFGLVLNPSLSAFLSLILTVWTFAAMVVAVRQAMDYESENRFLRFTNNGTERALLVCAVSWIILIVVFMVIGGLHGLLTHS